MSIESDSEKTIEFIYPKGTFRQISNAILDKYGMGVAEYAAKNPREAYLDLYAVTEAFAETSDTLNVGGTILTSKMDGHEAVRNAAKAGLESIGYDIDIEPIDVIISMRKNPSVLQALTGREAEKIEITSFRVEPPNLAF